MSTVELRKPVLTGGIQSVHFFNGRLLSAEDLLQEQSANRQARQRLGKALGDGVVYGFEVKKNQSLSTNAAPVVAVSEGLALNREGDALQLKDPINISLVRTPQAGTGTTKTVFADCQPPQAGAYVTGSGVYLLTIQSVSEKEGRAPVSGLGNLDAACNARYETAAVQFRLLQLAITPDELADTARLRNHLAYRCFGLGESAVTSFFANPFGPPVTKYGLLDHLRTNCLIDDEVPLALIHWTVRNGIEFIDMWSVRRRITQRPADPDWHLLISDRRQAESESMFLQFEEQIANIRTNEASSLGSIAATDRFKFLPPVGVLPIRGTNSPAGFDKDQFFGTRASRETAMLEARLVRKLLHESLYHEPIDLSKTERIRLYLIEENVLALEQKRANQMVLVFANSVIPYRDLARFGRAKWDISRFAEGFI